MNQFGVCCYFYTTDFNHISIFFVEDKCVKTEGAVNEWAAYSSFIHEHRRQQWPVFKQSFC